MSDTNETLKQLIESRLFIAKYSETFHSKLDNISDCTKHLIKNHKELNDLYDLFLDFIIDSRQYLDYNRNNESTDRV